MIRSSNGTLLSKGNASVRISVLQGIEAGNTVFSERYSAAAIGNGLGNFSLANYWSLSEPNSINAWFKNFVTRNNSSNFKNTINCRVSPIRSF